jgi:hypothetical protein
MPKLLKRLRESVEGGTAWDKFYEQRPVDMDERIDEIINGWSNVELLEQITALANEEEPLW